MELNSKFKLFILEEKGEMIVLTGSKGFIGKKFLEALKSQGKEVIK